MFVSLIIGNILWIGNHCLGITGRKRGYSFKTVSTVVLSSIVDCLLWTRLNPSIKTVLISASTDKSASFIRYSRLCLHPEPGVYDRYSLFMNRDCADSVEHSKTIQHLSTYKRITIGKLSYSDDYQGTGTMK